LGYCFVCDRGSAPHRTGGGNYLRLWAGISQVLFGKWGLPLRSVPQKECTVQLSQRLAGMTDKQWTEGLWRKLNIVQDFDLIAQRYKHGRT
jgi:hypothetical protein